MPGQLLALNGYGYRLHRHRRRRRRTSAPLLRRQRPSVTGRTLCDDDWWPCANISVPTATVPEQYLHRLPARRRRRRRRNATACAGISRQRTVPAPTWTATTTTGISEQRQRRRRLRRWRQYRISDVIDQHTCAERPPPRHLNQRCRRRRTSADGLPNNDVISPRRNPGDRLHRWRDHPQRPDRRRGATGRPPPAPDQRRQTATASAPTWTATTATRNIAYQPATPATMATITTSTTVIDANCNCAGTPPPAPGIGDNDGDGVCADVDCDDNDPVTIRVQVGDACDDGDKPPSTTTTVDAN